jgi:hypothetical protein
MSIEPIAASRQPGFPSDGVLALLAMAFCYAWLAMLYQI